MSAGDFEHADALPYVIVRLAPLLQQAFAEAIAEEGLTPRHFRILVQFLGEEPLTAASIARALDVTPQSVGPHIDALQARGLITRTPRPGRGRPNELTLTEEGTAVVSRAVRIAGTEQERIVGHMTPAQRRTMLRQLRAMAARAREPRE